MVVNAVVARKGRRFALLMAAHDSEYVLKKYGGYLNVFVAAFGDASAGETWDLYRAVDGELPGEGDLDRYDGFVISGSPNDAYADDEWILRLCELVRDVHARRKRVLGVCFGHQVICRALGGRVARASSGWDIGIREVAMAGVQLPGQCRFLDALRELPPSANITKIHQDEVWEVLASSDKTGVEMFRVGEHMLGIQGHPEYTNDILLNLVNRLLGAGSITLSFAEAVKRQLENTGPDREFCLKLCKSFLKADERSI
ncbi:hypothetical protein EJB05_43063, partial [Eragrostis curvula]